VRHNAAAERCDLGVEGLLDRAVDGKIELDTIARHGAIEIHEKRLRSTERH
jgi:hypothetical protein